MSLRIIPRGNYVVFDNSRLPCFSLLVSRRAAVDFVDRYLGHSRIEVKKHTLVAARRTKKFVDSGCRGYVTCKNSSARKLRRHFPTAEQSRR